MHEQIEVLGVKIDSLTVDTLLKRVEMFIKGGHQKIVLYVNVHCMDIASSDEEYKKLVNKADLVYCDGFGVVLGAKVLGKSLPGRITGADWIYDLAALCQQKQYRLFLLGGEEGVSEEASGKLKEKYPGLQIGGYHHGYLEMKKDGPDLINMINESRSDILLVGFGTPMQEKMIFRHRSHLQVPVIWAVGALMDFASGKVPRAPKWMLDNGFEWLYRFLVEPGRLWRRYLIGNSKFLFRVTKERLFKSAAR